MISYGNPTHQYSKPSVINAQLDKLLKYSYNISILIVNYIVHLIKVYPHGTQNNCSNHITNSNTQIHMTGAMTNPMNGILRLWKETLLLRLIDKKFFLTERSDSSHLFC